MWPRSDTTIGPGADLTAARKAKGAGLNGFVSYMTRRDAEDALREFDGFDWQGSVLRVGWSKAVPIAAKPLYGASSTLLILFIFSFMKLRLDEGVVVVVVAKAANGIEIDPGKKTTLGVLGANLVIIGIVLGRHVEGGLIVCPAATVALRVDITPVVPNHTMKQMQLQIHLFVP